jgi:regulatory protein
VGLVDDARFAREAVLDQTNRRLAGDRAVRSALRRKGVAQAVAEEAMMGAGDEADRARELALRRVTRMVGLAPEAAARRLYGVLVRRGYGHDVAREACRAAISEAFGQHQDPDRDT